MAVPYYIYFYVFECEHCHYPHLDTRLVPTIPQDQMDNDPSVWRCKKCNSPQSAVGYRTAAYAKKLLMSNGKCTERVSLNSLPPTNIIRIDRAARKSNLK
jgi:ribosomal protein L37AE/L43A